jgi:hypothetical protein
VLLLLAAKVSCAAAPVTLGWRSAASTLPPGPSAFARYGPNCSRALRDRPLVPDINAKGGVESGGAEDLKIAIFTLHIRPMASSEQAGGGQWRWAMAVWRAHRAERVALQFWGEFSL